MILAGDIGGTKVNLALFELSKGSLRCIKEHQFSSQKYDDFLILLDEFISLVGVKQFSAVALGVAGPVINGVCHTTNLPWHIDAQQLQKKLDVVDVYLLNDLETTAYGMLFLDDDEFLELNKGVSQKSANRAVIAAGTGLGEATLFFDGTQYHPIGSEGGHCDFAPQTPLQDRLLVWLRRRYVEHVSVERLVSGDGIYTIYEFLKEEGVVKESRAIEGIDKNAMVAKAALEEGDPLCLAAMKLFLEVYGAEAGNLALKSMSLGGLYIGGGIAPKIVPLLEDGTFLEAFTKKGRFKEMLENISIKVSLNQKTALLGAAHYAQTKMKE